MAKMLIIIGLLLIVYTMLASVTGLPHLTDFLPINTGDDYYKVVATDTTDKGPWYVSVVGVVFILLGCMFKYVFK